jgi:tetratricopeptide (TPR) repeat protein
LTAPSTTIPAAVFAGALLARAPSTAEAKDTDRWVRRGSVTLAAALAVCFAAAALAEVWLRLGDDAVAKGRLADANSDFNVARVLRPWDADLDAAAFHQFVASTTAGNAAAVPYAGKWGRHLAGVADDEQVVQNRAALLQAQGKFADAVALLDRQLTIDPDNPMVLLLRGVVRARQGDYGGAERDLMHSARVDRGNPKPWQDLAIIYKAEGKTALAARAAAKAAQLD